MSRLMMELGRKQLLKLRNSQKMTLQKNYFLSGIQYNQWMVLQENYLPSGILYNQWMVLQKVF